MTTEPERLSAADVSSLRVLLAKEQIKDALLRYCHGVDRGDADMISSAYHPDAHDDHVLFVATGATIGRTIVERLAGKSSFSMHFVTNQRIDVDGDTAYSETYNLVLRDSFDAENPPSDTSMRLLLAGNRYVDRFEQRDGEWRIAHRVCVQEFVRIDQVPRPVSAGRAGALSLRSLADLSYLRGPFPPEYSA